MSEALLPQQPVNTSATAMDLVTAPPRLEHTVACLPIVYGSVAFYLGKKADENNTHQWTLYLRGPNNEDLSGVIEKVVFQLHASFAQPLREITTPPYEVTERGWGEFEAQIRITWKDPNEKSTYVSHGIKLYPPGTPSNVAPTDTETPVVAESYDEVVFTDPTETFFEQLQKVEQLPPSVYSQADHFPTYADTEDAQALVEANKFLQRELAAIQERLQTVDGELQRTDDQIRQAQERQKVTASTANRSSKASIASATSTSSAAAKKN
mmetsp:Transcript_9084/g.17324  ORF Transcript_9084/g.17324 Transcript_9084/m.17324 type:complete len:267 (+) Transcript_9084:50-850(+)